MISLQVKAHTTVPAPMPVGLAAAAVAVIAAWFAAYPAEAQTARSGGSNASAQLLQQMQQLASERTSLQAENAKMKKELEDLRKERDSLKNTQKTTELRSKASAAAAAQGTARREALEREIQQGKERTEQLVVKFRETIQTLRQVESENTVSQQKLTQRDSELKVCVDRNVALYKLNEEVLTRFEHQSVWSRAAAAEPFTRIKRARLENLVDEYKAKADDQRVTPEVLKAAASAPLPATPPPASTPNQPPR